MKIVFLGGCDVDQSYSLCQDYPPMGGKAFIRNLGVKSGGMVANASRVASGLGVSASMIHELNESDPASRVILDELNFAGVDTRLISLGARPNKNCLLIHNRQGERVIFVVQEDAPPIRLSQQQKDALFEADGVYTTSSDIKIFEGIELLFKELRAAGVLTFIDCDAHFSPEDLPFLEGASMISINEFGYAEIKHAGLDAVSLQKYLKLEYFLFTKGAEGAEIYTKERHILQPALPAHVLDTTGAGDAFNVSFFYAILEGWDPERAALFAAGAAAQAIAQKGPHPRLDKKALDRLVFRRA